MSNPPQPPPSQNHEEEPQPSPHQSLIILPYQGSTGDSILKQLKRNIGRIVPRDTLQTRFAYTSTKLSTNFNTKDKIDKTHQHDVIYLATCPEPMCEETYIGETSRRLEERVRDHGGRDNASHVNRHSIETGHPAFGMENFKIIGKRFSNWKRRKLAEALEIKDKRPSLNAQETHSSIRLLN